MPKAGDSYMVVLAHSPVDWGDGARKTKTRASRRGEGYIPIPRKYACKYQIINSNGLVGNDMFGQNLFKCDTSDGYLKDEILKASGCSQKGDRYAKQFQGLGNLKLLGGWFQFCSAKIGDKVKVEWISSDKILLTHISV